MSCSHRRDDGLAAAIAASDDGDPEYVSFLKHLRPDHNRRSYILDLPSSCNDTNAGGVRRGGGEAASSGGLYIHYECEDDDASAAAAAAAESCLSCSGKDNDDDDTLSIHSCPHEEEDEKESRASSSFEKKLKEIVERPFDRCEYDRLMELAAKTKPQLKFKHLRNSDVCYETDHMGSSYFDYHPELAKKVKRADFITGLKLLRGFFFWLKNLEHDGAYKPWE